MTKASRNKNEGTPIISHQQSSISRIAKKKQRRISERSKLKDAWNTPEFLAQFTSKTRQRRSAQATQTAQHAEGQASEHAAKGQHVQQTERMTVDPSTHVNTPRPTNTPTNTNTVAQDIANSMQLTSSPSLSLFHKRKATDIGADGNLNVNESYQQQQHTEKVIVLEVTDDNSDASQPTLLQSQPKPTESITPNPKARAYPKSNAPAKSKAPRKKVELRASTSRKHKTPAKAALVSALAPTNVQPTMPPSNAVLTPSRGNSHLRWHAPYQGFTATESLSTNSPPTNAYIQSPANTHMQLSTNNAVHPSVSADSRPSNHSYSEHYSESITPYSGSSRHENRAMASFYRDLASCYQAPASSTASDAIPLCWPQKPMVF